MAKVQSIVERIKTALRDSTGDNWSESSIIQSIYDAELAIVGFRPDASAMDVDFPCAQGSRQSIAGISPKPNRLLDVKYNRYADVDGRSVNRRSRSDLDSINPNWMNSGGSTIVREFVFDDREPLLFYVNPPAGLGTKLRISYSAIPAAYPDPITESTETTINDIYEPAIFEWAMYLLFSHDAEGSVNASRAQQHLATFQAIMGVKVDSDGQFSPRNPEHKR